LIAYSFIAPNFFGFAVFTLIPMVFSMVLSLMKWNGAGNMEFAGLDNFSRLFSDKAFIKALINTTVYTIDSLVSPLATASICVAIFHVPIFIIAILPFWNRSR